MSPPLCKACGVTACTQLESDNLQTVWQRESGYKWSWHSDLQAYWVLCLPCHRVAWPTDHRVRNHFSQPGWLYRSSRGSKGRVKLVSGDFFLTDPVPEFFRQKAHERHGPALLRWQPRDLVDRLLCGSLPPPHGTDDPTAQVPSVVLLLFRASPQGGYPS